MNLYDFGDIIWSWFWDVFAFFNKPIFALWGMEVTMLMWFISFFVINLIFDVFGALFGIFYDEDDGIAHNRDITFDTETGEVL